MPRQLEIKLSGQGLKFALVAARFNDAITDRLLDAAADGLRRHDVDDDDITIVRVPGAFELPLAVQVAAESGKYDAIVALGALIRGATSHYDVLAREVTSGLGRTAQSTGVPVSFGVLTCDTLEQAIERAGGKGTNKGFEVAVAALEMALVVRALRSTAGERA